MAREYEGPDKRKGWHVSREISLGDVIGLLSALAAVLIAYGNINTRVSLLEQSSTVQAGELDRSVKRLESSLDKVDAKLDRILDARTARAPVRSRESRD